MSEDHPPRIGAALWTLAALSAACYGALWQLGPRYALTVPCQERPLLLVLVIYAAACLLYFVALRLAVRLPDSRKLIAWLVGTSLLFRCLMLPSPPLQEIDIYRYLWDGAVTAAGLDPYRHPPQSIVTLLDSPEIRADDDSLTEAARLVEQSPALEEVLRTIHYSGLTTPYPPVSQAVFALSAMATPDGWSATARLNLLKGVLVLFDLATLLLVVLLLRRTGKPVGWALAYGWCPLVMKEIAGSGHLDSIAVFFTTAAALLSVEAIRAARDGRSNMWPALGAAVLLAFGCGAKLYPIVLMPLLASRVWRDAGWRRALLVVTAFALATGAALAPMAFHDRLWPNPASGADSGLAAAPPLDMGDSGAEMLPPPPTGVASTPAPEAPSGLSAFLSTWEMNDFAFMILIENLRPQAKVPDERRPWFDVTPEEFNTRSLEHLRDLVAWFAPESEASLSDSRLVFLTTRVITLALFGLIAIGLAWWASRAEADSRAWLRAAFLTLAWFWLLAPTQNPWYWCWALPLVPFVRSRAWLAMSAVCFLYYLRFWYECHHPEPGVYGSVYDGSHFYYFVVVWWEFAPLLLWLACESLAGGAVAVGRLWRRSQNDPAVNP